MEKSDPKDYTIRVNKLRKIYMNNKVAVDQISFGINQGEVILFIFKGIWVTGSQWSR